MQKIPYLQLELTSRLAYPHTRTVQSGVLLECNQVSKIPPSSADVEILLEGLKLLIPLEEIPSSSAILVFLLRLLEQHPINQFLEEIEVLKCG